MILKINDISNWSIINDGVMGGISQSSIIMNEQDNAVFSGFVSLENNGGFCSVRYNFDRLDVQDYSKVTIRLRGDGKRYQFRIKSNRNDYHSYISYFQTSGEWQEIIIPLNEMYASARGIKLNMPDFQGENIEEIAFLIGNRKEEHFRLEIDKVCFVFKVEEQN